MNTAVNFCGVDFRNPIITASGTFNFGEEYSQYFNLAEIGGITVKGLSLNERAGNPPPRIAETYAGMLNSVGLQNPGVRYFLDHHLDKIGDTRIIVNIAGHTIEECAQIAEMLQETNVDLLELNVSCPNVKEGGVAFGTNTKMLYQITKEVKDKSKQPLVVKLSPNVTSITDMAKAAEQGGADGLSLINTLIGMRIDIERKMPILANVVGGLSGPAIFPVALRMVWQVSRAVNLPIIGMGGVSSGEDAVEMMMAGATLVAVGTASFVNPTAAVDVKNGLCDYMKRHNIVNVNELRIKN